MSVVRASLLFLIAGLCEIGGGYLIWLWLRSGRSYLLGIAGAAIIVLYGVIPTFQNFPHFGRVYAAYGGVFVVLSVLWGWGIDGVRPDKFDIIGSAICLGGVSLILYGPRG